MRYKGVGKRRENRRTIIVIPCIRADKTTLHIHGNIIRLATIAGVGSYGTNRPTYPYELRYRIFTAIQSFYPECYLIKTRQCINFWRRILIGTTGATISKIPNPTACISRTITKSNGCGRTLGGITYFKICFGPYQFYIRWPGNTIGTPVLILHYHFNIVTAFCSVCMRAIVAIGRRAAIAIIPGVSAIVHLCIIVQEYIERTALQCIVAKVICLGLIYPDVVGFTNGRGTPKRIGNGKGNGIEIIIAGAIIHFVDGSICIGIKGGAIAEIPLPVYNGHTGTLYGSICKNKILVSEATSSGGGCKASLRTGSYQWYNYLFGDGRKAADRVGDFQVYIVGIGSVQPGNCCILCTI